MLRAELFLALTSAVCSVLACTCALAPTAAPSAMPVAATSAPAIPAQAAAARMVSGATHVNFPSRDADLTRGAPTSIDGWLFRPAGAGPFPAVILFHGCAGLFRAVKPDLPPRERDYADRLVGQGYVVLLPDSFSPRGVEEICSHHDHPIRPSYERSRDAYGALAWLQAQPFVRADRVGALGWSHGAITVLGTLAKETQARPAGLAHDFRVGVALYPDCRRSLKQADWAPPVAPLHVLIGEKDDWTRPGPCIELVDRARGAGAPVDIVVYPDAYHDFDDPVMKLHVRSNVGGTESGTATLGMNPAARADAIGRVDRILRDALAP